MRICPDGPSLWRAALGRHASAQRRALLGVGGGLRLVRGMPKLCAGDRLLHAREA